MKYLQMREIQVRWHVEMNCFAIHPSIYEEQTIRNGIRKFISRHESLKNLLIKRLREQTELLRMQI